MYVHPSFGSRTLRWAISTISLSSWFPVPFHCDFDQTPLQVLRSPPLAVFVAAFCAPVVAYYEVRRVWDISFKIPVAYWVMYKRR